MNPVQLLTSNLFKTNFNTSINLPACCMPRLCPLIVIQYLMNIKKDAAPLYPPATSSHFDPSTAFPSRTPLIYDLLLDQEIELGNTANSSGALICLGCECQSSNIHLESKWPPYH
jgi:hypothetical protein